MQWSEPAPARIRQRLQVKRRDYYGVTSRRDDGEVIQIGELVDFVAQHHARW